VCEAVFFSVHPPRRDELHRDDLESHPAHPGISGVNLGVTVRAVGINTPGAMAKPVQLLIFSF
jgi:hypothetical protein